MLIICYVLFSLVPLSDWYASFIGNFSAIPAIIPECIVRSCTCICFNCLVTYHSVCSLLDWYVLFVGNLSSISCISGVHKVRSCACIPIYFLPNVLMTSFRAHYRWNFSILDRIHRVELFGDPDICYKIEKQM